MAVPGEGAASNETPRQAPRPADGLVGIAPLVALALLLLNDHWLKAAWPGFVTGKASDVAGLVLAPLVLQAGWEVGRWVAGRWTGPSLRSLAVSIATVGVGFAVVKAWQPATDAWRVGLGLAQWPFAVVAALLGGTTGPALAPVVAVTDPGDLLALPALAISWWAGNRRAARWARAPK
jgi:hypothetical protein